MMIVSSPYNFVPLNSTVFFPEWAPQVSHDLPFSDGESGEIPITITTQGPFFIRDAVAGAAEKEGKKKDPREELPFTLPDGRACIPGSSLKGALRSIVEAIGFGKLGAYNERRYSQRDLRDGAYRDKITESTPRGYRPMVSAGFLRRRADDDKAWEILPCSYGRVEQEDLWKFLRPRAPEIGTERENGPAKYQRFGNLERLQIEVALGEEKGHPHSCGKLIYSKVSFEGPATTKGLVVLTGQPSQRRRGERGRKHLEFFFHGWQGASALAVGEQSHRDFLSIHSDDMGAPNDELRFWTERLAKKEMGPFPGIPVFYREYEPASGGKLLAIGLSMMFRFPYQRSLRDLALASQPEINDSRPDLAETMFGYTRSLGDRFVALRGRVHIGHCVTTQPAKPLPPIETVLGAPKPSFFPNYLRQNKNGSYTTFEHAGARLRGRKRYYVRQDKRRPAPPAPPSRDVAVRFAPLPSGTTFKGTIRFHNLRPFELGALIWSINFGNQKSDDVRHLLGMAKPLGFGAVKIEIDENSIRATTKSALVRASVAFAENQPAEFAKIWQSTEGQAIRKALALFSRPTTKSEDALEYPTLKPNQFVAIKKALASLEDLGAAQAKQRPQVTKAVRAELIAEILVETTRNKGIKLRLLGDDPKAVGIVKPGAQAPKNPAPGKRYFVRIHSKSPGNYQFEILGEA
jgi:CRISPR-associated protein (TIGR03986 family)